MSSSGKHLETALEEHGIDPCMVDKHFCSQASGCAWRGAKEVMVLRVEEQWKWCLVEILLTSCSWWSCAEGRRWRVGWVSCSWVALFAAFLPSVTPLFHKQKVNSQLERLSPRMPQHHRISQSITEYHRVAEVSAAGFVVELRRSATRQPRGTRVEAIYWYALLLCARWKL